MIWTLILGAALAAGGQQPQYQHVAVALPDGRPDMLAPVNSWTEVRTSRSLVATFSLGPGLTVSDGFSYRSSSLGSLTRGGDEDPPASLSKPFTIPAPSAPIPLAITLPRSTFRARDLLPESGKSVLIFEVRKETTRAESRFAGGRQYLRYETLSEVVDYETEGAKKGSITELRKSDTRTDMLQIVAG